WVWRSKESRVSVCTRFPFSRWDFLDGDKLEVSGLCALNSTKRDRRIEGGEPSLIRQRERAQINVRELAMALHVFPSKAAVFPHLHQTCPEDVLPMGGESSQSSRTSSTVVREPKRAGFDSTHREGIFSQRKTARRTILTSSKSRSHSEMSTPAC